ncbi:MAG: hypothetical protein V1859_05310 [archaeon]
MFKMDYLPDLRLIERARTTNEVYPGEDFEVVLITKLNETTKTYEISLSAERKRDSSSFRLETRIALEKHVKDKGHEYPHLQIDNFTTDEEILKLGTLHVTLLVENEDQLNQCCNGFVYSLSEIIPIIEDIFQKKVNLKDYFFNSSPLNALSKDKITLQGLIYKSFLLNRALLEGKQIDLIEYLGKKSEPTLNTGNYFKVLKILVAMRVLSPLMLKPILDLIYKDKSIRTECKNFSTSKAITLLTQKSQKELIHYSRDQFIKDFN